MQALSWSSIFFYCAFSIFVFYQQLHVKNFQGASQVFAMVLSISAFAGMLVGLAYLAYYGWSVAWWTPLVILAIGLIATVVGAIAERIVGAMMLSLGGFIGWPICAYFMFHYIPKAA